MTGERHSGRLRAGSSQGPGPVVRARRPHRRPRRAARQLGAAEPGLGPRGMRRRHQGRRLRPGAGADRQGAHQRRLQDVLRRQRGRGPRRARGAAGRHHLRARRPAARRRGALRGLRSAPRALEPAGGARLGRLLPRARAPAGGSHPHRHRHEPPRHARERARAAGSLARAARRLRDDAGHEPSRLRRSRRRPHERAPAPALRGAARQAAARAGEPRQLRRHVPGARLSFRPGAAGHRALRRPRARGQAQPDADGGAARRPDPAGARGGARRAPSATAPPTRCRSPRASPPSPSATPTASCAP